MADGVVLGSGSLAGRGVYAARVFAAGDVVLHYRLQTLDEAEYLALPAGDELFVHSFAGSRYLYPAPARFVNHSDDPSCVQDFDRYCEIARRPIAIGEAITIDAHQETAHELSTFLDAYNQALLVDSQALLGSLVDENARLWWSGPPARGRAAVVAALLTGAPAPALTRLHWLVGTGRWEALRSADAETGDATRHHTMLMKVIRGNWQLVYEHIG